MGAGGLHRGLHLSCLAPGAYVYLTFCATTAAADAKHEMAVYEDQRDGVPIRRCVLQAQCAQV